MIGTEAVQAGRPAAAILAFPGASDRPSRSAPGRDEPRGEILLFTGVRYERLEVRPADRDRPVEPTPPAGRGVARRRRRS